ncbi:DUF547 domain-containing protein [Microvirga sp. STS02]|uniref:DUF547 domain-containing protein n=1 Tax=Hymenobacter negativus TaxID=2795026 RepID=UPI0018DCC346|nr:MULTISPECIES: DUF547 domain-containing protein [Bacteria]MBH8569123.1 DUF547 domain-containing protein [Hymenobacter negativus]MBR7208858.1 DUF547 domain-containing protein [Microvirga sp. STS02]
MKSTCSIFGMFWAVLLILVLGGKAVAGGNEPLTVASITVQTTAFLQKFVNKEGKVSYEALQHSPELLDALLSNIADFDVTKAEAADQYAFYLNAYNILVIGEVVKNYPLTSVQDMPGFFNRVRMRVGREMLTLDQIETDKLRKIYDDPRLHFALVCGTNSCPRLSRTAYVGKDLFAQLNNQARFALLDPSYVQVDDAKKVVRLPEIFQWYESDFRASGNSGVMYVNQFRKNNRIPTWYTVEYYPYNWSLNDQKHPDSATMASK